MVPAAGCYDSRLLPLGAGTSDGSAEKRNTAINDRDLCGAAGAEAGVTQRCGTLRHTAYWKRQSGHLPGMRCGTAEAAGGASAPMLNDFTDADKVYIACGCTDLRKGIDGLARLVQQQFELDPFTNTLFCSADGGETVSRACTGKRTASSCCTSDWSRARINGRAQNPR